MRGLTDEERLALVSDDTHRCDPELGWRLVRRGLLTPVRKVINGEHLIAGVLTPTGHLVLRLDAAARSLVVTP